MSSKINLQTCEYACKSSIFQDNQLIYTKCKIGEMKYGKYSTAKEAEQAGAEGISPQTARELVRGIARDTHCTEWESL